MPPHMLPIPNGADMGAVSRRLAMMFAVLTLLAGACSSSAESGDGGSEGASGTDDQGSDGSAGGDDSAGDDSAGDDNAGDDSAPVVVSFIVTDLTAVSAALGWEAPDQGDMPGQIEALVARANAAGGMGGRPIDPRIHVFNAITDSPISEEQLCNAITQDDNADIVVLTGQFQDNARPCYAAAGTMMVDLTLFPVDEVGYDELSPYLWSPLLPSYDDLIAGLADALEAEGWFEGATVGVVGIDSDMNRRVHGDTLAPRLDAAGVEVASVNWVDPTDGTSLEAGQQQAILDFKDAGVDKVLVIGGSRLASFMMDIGATQNFSPAYAVTSYDSPEFNIRNTPDLMAGASGISVLPGWDVADDQYPVPANDAEADCLAMLEEDGHTFESRANSRSALLYCDAVRILQLVGETMTGTDAEAMGSAMAGIGDFESASVYSVTMSDGSYTGSAGYRGFSFDPDCDCMVLADATVEFQE